MKKLLIVLMCVLLSSGCMPRPSVAQNQRTGSMFDQCVAAGYQLIHTYPTRCITPDGRVFFKENTQKSDKNGMCKDLCGDGVCQQIVCQGQNCPCAETPVNCQQDCVVNE